MTVTNFVLTSSFSLTQRGKLSVPMEIMARDSRKSTASKTAWRTRDLNQRLRHLSFVLFKVFIYKLSVWLKLTLTLPVMGFSRSTAWSLGSIGIFISFYFQTEIVVHVNVGQTVDQTVVKDQQALSSTFGFNTGLFLGHILSHLPNWWTLVNKVKVSIQQWIKLVV